MELWLSGGGGSSGGNTEDCLMRNWVGIDQQNESLVESAFRKARGEKQNETKARERIVYAPLFLIHPFTFFLFKI